MAPAPERLRWWRLALAVVGGNLLLHQLPGLPRGAGLWALALLAVLVFRRFPLAACTALSFCWTAWSAGAALDARWPPELDGRDIELSGWIDDVPRRESGRTVFSLRVVETDAENAPRRVRLSWYEPAPSLAAGQSLKIEARLRSPRGLMNPGSFDYERWLFIEGYDATGYVRSGSADPARRFGWRQTWLEIRARMADRLAERIRAPDAVALVQALALGERGRFEDRHWTVLQRTGTSHLVAVSGLHIGLIAALCYFPVTRAALYLPYPLARRAHWLGAGASIAAAAAYAALAGFTLPTRRALIMLLVVQALAMARRRWPLGSGFGIALIAIVLIDPLASLSASFWLSFGAVALLLASAAGIEYPLRPRQPGALAGARRFGVLQVGLTLGLAPVVIWYFGQFSVLSVVINLVAIPLFGLLVVPLTLVAAVLAGFDSLGSPVFDLTRLIVGWTWSGLELTAGFEFAAIELSRPPVHSQLLALGAVVMGIASHRLPGRRLALLALLPLVVSPERRPSEGFARATVFDVGHGLAVAIETAEHRVLYDAGPRFRSGFDAGAEIVGPSLAAQSRDPVDILIVSHGDSDHAGGTAAILERYPGARVIAGPDVDEMTAEPCVQGSVLELDGVEFRFLHPPEATRFDGNDSSCVVLIETLAGNMLLTGDIETRAESALARSTELGADIVIVPHHGSATSSTRAFVAAVEPSAAIVSAAYNNRWGFPREEVVSRWQRVGAVLLTTGEHGAIGIDFDVDGISLSAARYGRRRYWQPKVEPVSGAADASAL